MTAREPLTVWAVSDGRIGMENQALGLAEAIGRQTDCTIVTKRLNLSKPFDALPGRLWGDPWSRLSADSDRLDPPYPDIWIACGRRTLPFSQRMREKGAFVVQTQDPRTATIEPFDLVIPPRHDVLRGANVFPLLGAPNRLTEDKISQDAQQLRPALPTLPDRLAAVLIGGRSKDYPFKDDDFQKIIATLRDVMATGTGLLITTSRRTGDERAARLRAALAGPRAWVWDGTPIGGLINPYLGILGLASRILATPDSANMLTDAAFTGKPVHLLPLTGGAPKWERFHDDLRRAGVLNPSAGMKDVWPYSALRETDRAATEVLRRYADVTCTD